MLWWHAEISWNFKTVRFCPLRPSSLLTLLFDYITIHNLRHSYLIKIFGIINKIGYHIIVVTYVFQQVAGSDKFEPATKQSCRPHLKVQYIIKMQKYVCLCVHI